MIENLKKFVSTASNSGSGIMFARELIKQLETRFPACGSKVDLNCYGNYLDPSLKGLHLKLFENFDETKNKLGNILHEFISEETEELERQENETLDNQEEGEEDPRSKLKKQLMADERRAAPVSNSLHSRFEKECKLYEDMPDMPPGCDVLRYGICQVFYVFECVPLSQVLESQSHPLPSAVLPCKICAVYSSCKFQVRACVLCCRTDCHCQEGQPEPREGGRLGDHDMQQQAVGRICD